MLKQFVAILLLGLGALPTLAQPILSGAVQFSANSSGAATGGQIWNTLGSDGLFNLYFTQPNTGIGGSLLNSGNGASTALNLTLAPGAYEFFYFGQPGSDTGFAALNLFFDGNTSTPRISVFAATDTAAPSPPYPSFSANSSTNTLTLAGSIVAGAGTLSYSSGGFTVTLTDYGWSTPGVFGLDRVQAFSNAPGGGNDFVGMVRLSVTSVPEPGSLVLGALAVSGFLAWRRGQIKRGLDSSEPESL